MRKTIEILVKVYADGRRKKMYEEVKDDYNFPSIEEIKEKAGKRYYIGKWVYYVITQNFAHIIEFSKGIREGRGSIKTLDRTEIEWILMKMKEVEEFEKVRGDE